MSGTRAVSVDTRHAHHRAPQYLFSDLLLQRPRVILGGTPPSKVQEVCQCECTMHEPPQRRFSHNALATKHARTIQRVQPAFLDCVRFDNVPKLRSAWRGRQRGSLRATEQSYQEQHALDVSTVNTASAVCVKEVEDLAKEQHTCGRSGLAHCPDNVCPYDSDVCARRKRQVHNAPLEGHLGLVVQTQLEAALTSPAGPWCVRDS